MPGPLLLVLTDIRLKNQTRVLLIFKYNLFYAKSHDSTPLWVNQIGCLLQLWRHLLSRIFLERTKLRATERAHVRNPAPARESYLRSVE